jgi:M6 family metalloprotease-like protein
MPLKHDCCKKANPTTDPRIASLIKLSSGSANRATTMLVLNYLVLAALLLAKTSAFVFPDHFSDTSQWETVEQYRERLNITFTYQPVHIHPEYCRYITEDVCRADDEAAARSIEKRRQRRLNPSMGSFTFLVILVQFTDHKDRVLPPKEYYEELCNGSGPSAINAVGSISEYFAHNSYGQFNINCEVMDWRLTNNTEDFYAKGVKGIVGSERGQDFFRPVLDEIEADSDQWYFFGLDGTDGDNDGQIELVVLHSGYAADGIATDCYGRGQDDRIWSQGHQGTDRGGWATGDKNFEVTGYTVASALDHRGDCKGEGAKMGTITHEMFHTFGASDLYDPTRFETGGVGAFDILSLPYGQGFDLARPGSASAYTKIRAGWVIPVEITQDGVYDINASVDSDLVYIIRDKYATDEYLLFENRQVASFDANFWGDGGLVIYHIDEQAGLQNTRGFPGQDGWPGNGNHYRVAVLQADGRYDLEQLRNEGDEGDLYVAGRSLGPGDGSTYPNTDSYQSGTIISTGITITDISVSGPTMSFRVTGLQPGAQPSAIPSGSPSVNPSGAPSAAPSVSPSGSPSGSPSANLSAGPNVSLDVIPSGSPSFAPSAAPSGVPSVSPSSTPSDSPSAQPSAIPSGPPSGVPSGAPSAAPSNSPSGSPSGSPSANPSAGPSASLDVIPSGSPSFAPSAAPSRVPSVSPSSTPSASPSAQPSAIPSGSPSGVPSGAPSAAPSDSPSGSPGVFPGVGGSGGSGGLPPSPDQPLDSESFEPSAIPSGSPSVVPSGAPSPGADPTNSPTEGPTVTPSVSPTTKPTKSPSEAPTVFPTVSPTFGPTIGPTTDPTVSPTESPSSYPSGSPSAWPSARPSVSLSVIPSGSPSFAPSAGPSVAPNGLPSVSPSSAPSASPLARPSAIPSGSPSTVPSGAPSTDPSDSPSGSPSGSPSTLPSARPSVSPSAMPSGSPSFAPSASPSAAPSGVPSVSPSYTPSAPPSAQPSAIPSGSPSVVPSGAPSTAPIGSPRGSPSAWPSARPSASPSASSAKLIVRAGTVKLVGSSGGSTGRTLKVIAIVGLVVILLAIGTVFFFFVVVSRRALLPRWQKYS